MNDISEKPDTIRSHPFKEWVRINFLSSHLSKLPKDKKILDLACGWGFSFKINPNFHGVEYDAACVDHLIKHGHKVTRANILEKLPLPDESYDIVFTHDVLEHFDRSDSETIFKNVLPILKLGGLFLNIVPNKLGYDFGLKINAGHKYYITPKDLQDIASHTGFEYEGFYYSPFPGFFDHFYKHNKRVISCRRPER